MSEERYDDEMCIEEDEIDCEEPYNDGETDDEEECNERTFYIEEGIELALSPVLKPLPKKSKKCGRIDLPDSEIASLDELERMVYKQEFEAILNLPVKTRKNWIKPNIDDDGDVSWGAFGTVDFDRYTVFDKARYKAEKLKEQLKDLAIMVSIINDRIQTKAKYKVLKYVRAGTIDVDDIGNWNMWQLAKLYMRALGLRKQIVEIQESSRCRKEQQVQRWLDSLG